MTLTPDERNALPANGGDQYNRLIFESSPYLLQHAANPVDWYPWGEAAFARARDEDKPVFLSVGYSSCHWCHVMEHESFEDAGIAAYLNEHCVPVKVDREERPDIDEVYMTATQLMSGRGGWPNSVWLMPDRRPWYCGTYFPPADRGGMPGFLNVLRQLQSWWTERREDVEAQADQLTEAIRRTMAATAQTGDGRTPDVKELTDLARGQWLSQYDGEHGGFGSAPKFPPHAALRFLLTLPPAERGERVERMLHHTLEAMALGGIHDVVGGGFHRYATDAEWVLPHFEKMLYDNAQLGWVYAEAAAQTGRPLYADTARGLFDWVLRDMTDELGGFTSALDADSGGEEGRFYVWTLAEIDAALPAEDAEPARALFHLTAEGNYRDEATGRRTGANILRLETTLGAHAEALGMPEAELRDRVAAIRERLLAVRESRVWPGLDDKVLTGWNGLMIGALARGAVALDEPRYREAAERAAGFLWDRQRVDGLLRRSWREGRGHIPAYLEDAAYLADGLIELYRATGESLWLERATTLAEEMLERFADPEGGGLYTTGPEHEDLPARSKDPLDQSVPSANGVAARVLSALGAETGETRWTEAGREIITTFAPIMEKAPTATATLLGAARSAVRPGPAAGAADGRALRWQSGPVEARLDGVPERVQPGEEFSIALVLEIEDRRHLTAADAKSDSLAAFRIEPVASGDGFEHLGTEYAASTRLTFPGMGDAIPAYVGKTVHIMKWKAPMTARRDPALTFRMTLQPCNDRVCERPRTHTWSVTLPLDNKKDSP